jgi:GNAT superfamily N-acetyltransferase
MIRLVKLIPYVNVLLWSTSLGCVSLFRVRTMSAEDFEFAIEITDPMDWGLTRADFEFMLKLEPEGCFVLHDDLERVGIATTVSFGQVGWFGNLIVRENERKKGEGSLLVTHALKYLQAKKVKSVGLYAYPEAIPFYTKLGFKYDSDFTVLKGQGVSSSIDARVTEAQRQNLEQIIEFDQNCFGATRRKVVEPIIADPGNFCYTVFEDNRLVGFIATAIYGETAELGPMVCRQGRSDVAISLINASLDRLKGYEVSLCMGKKEVSVIDTLIEHGFTESFRVSRMFFGKPIIKDCIYAAESLERG